jgi:hypothetical protein
MAIPCFLDSQEFTKRAIDTLKFYKFNLVSLDSGVILTTRRIEDGLSKRNIELSVEYDSVKQEGRMQVKTLIRFQGEDTEIYYDESPRITNDFRSDFKPVLTALRQMCTPPKKKKKSSKK